MEIEGSKLVNAPYGNMRTRPKQKTTARLIVKIEIETRYLICSCRDPAVLCTRLYVKSAEVTRACYKQ